MPKDIYALVGKRVREERHRLRLTLEQLAELSGLSPSFIAYIETRGRKASLATIEKLSAALRIPVAELFSDSQPPKPDDLYDSARRFALLVRDREPEERAVLLDMVKTVSAKFGKARPYRSPRSSRA